MQEPPGLDRASPIDLRCGASRPTNADKRTSLWPATRTVTHKVNGVLTLAPLGAVLLCFHIQGHSRYIKL